MSKPVRLFTCFWGKKHQDLFADALLPSLCWPQNKAALQDAGAVWEIWTKKDEFKDVALLAKELGVDVILNEADQYLADLESKYLSDSGVMMNEMFKASIQRCLDTNSQMLMAPPDTIFGGDSIPNILQAGEVGNRVVFVFHMRVLPSILKDLAAQGNRFGPASSIGNAKLLKLSLRNAHRSFTEAEVKGDRINGYIGGIFWKRRPNGIIAAQHCLMTPYLINWTEEDLAFFARENPPGTWPPVYGEIDHLWPGVLVYPKDRAVVLGSSDDAFMCEITEAEANVPPLQHYSASDPDLFWRGAIHNKINRVFNITLREE